MTDKVQKIREEVVSIDFEQELYKAFGQVKDFTLGMQIAKWFYDMGRNSQEPVSKQNLSNVQRTVKNWKETVSEDFGKAAKKWLRPQLDKSYANYGEAKKMELTRFDGYAMLDAIEFGVKWQKQHSKCPLDCPAFSDGYKIGMKEAKQQMMKDAFECKVKVDAGGYPYIPQMELYDYDKDIPLAKEGDRYKVILIKED